MMQTAATISKKKKSKRAEKVKYHLTNMYEKKTQKHISPTKTSIYQSDFTDLKKKQESSKLFSYLRLQHLICHDA